MDPIPVIPTLHAKSNPVLKDLGEKAAYTVRWFFANPGRTSSVNEAEIISFRKLNASFGNRPEMLCEKIAESLRLIMLRYTKDVDVTCNFKAERGFNDDGSLAGNYTLEISITDTNGQPLIPASTIKILKNGDEIDCKFN